MEYSVNPETGQVYQWDPSGGPDWQEVPRSQTAQNPDTKQVYVLKGDKWQELPSPSQGPLKDALHNVITGAVKGVGGLIDTVLGAGKGVTQGALNEAQQTQQALANTGLTAAPGPLPELTSQVGTGQDFSNAAFRSGMPYYTPSTGAGRVGQAAVAGGTAGTLLGGPPGAVAGAIGGAAQQGAAEAGLPPWAQTVAGIGAPLLVGGAAVGTRAMFPGASRAVEDLAQRLTPQQINDAYALVQAARAHGTNLTWPEAFAQVTGGDMRQFLNIQRVLEQSRGGSSVLDRFMADRIAGNRTAMQGQLDQIGPQLQGQALGDVPINMQAAAESATAAARRARFNAADPHYTQGRADNIPLADAQGILQRIDAAIAARPSNAVLQQLQQFRQDLLIPAQGHGQAPQLKTNIGMLDSVAKQWRERMDAGQRPGQLSTDALANETNAILGPIVTDMRAAMTRASEPHAFGRVTHAQQTEQVVNPLQRGPVGQLEKAAPTLVAQRSIIAPVGEQGVLDPAQVRFTVQQLQQHGAPDAVRNWVRTNLQSQFDELTQSNIAGGNQWGGAKFRAAVAGNAQQAANLEALITSLPGGRAAWAGLNRLMQVYEAQGRRQAPGSMTEFNRQITDQIGGGRLNLQFVSKAQDALDRWRYYGRTDRLAQLITDPNNVDRWRALSQGRRAGGGFALGIVPQGQPMSTVPALGSGNLFGAPR